MRKNKEFWGELLALMELIPYGAYFQHDGTERVLQFQATTQAEARNIRACFAGTTWTKEYQKSTAWWEYSTEFDGWEVRIYAVREAPAICTPIYEDQTVEERVPVEFETRTVTKRVLVGHDCGPEEVTA